MEKIDEQLNNLSIVEIPIGVHQSVMRKVHYHKLRPALFVGFVLLTLNFLIIAWHINAKLIDAEFLDMAQDLFEVFKFDFSFVGAVWGSFFEIISPTLALSAVLSLVGAIYIGKKIASYQFNFIK
jgi:hypothetical protein